MAVAQESGAVRRARQEDVAAIHALITELAVYEREADAVETTVADLEAALFGPAPLVHCHVAEVTDSTGRLHVAGMALWFVSFSTWRGRHGIWLEDLYVQPAQRGQGLGRALLGELAAECTRRGYPRLEWLVLDWNESAHAFYAAAGAQPQNDWTTWRLDGQALAALGKQ